MIENNTIHRILKFFFQYPTREIHLRALARTLTLSLPSTLQYVKTLKKKGFVTTRSVGNLVLVRANLESEEFMWRKRLDNISALYESELIEHIRKTIHPRVLICFGSYSRGDDIESSDIDIASIGGHSAGTLPEKFEKELKRNISLRTIDMNKISEEFRKNLYNGVILWGAW